MALKTDYIEDVFEGNRKYRISTDGNGISEIVDVTDYAQEGDKFGADDANAITQAVEDHLADTENPHGVTAEQVGLGNVDNTADADKTVAVAKKVGTGTVGSTTTPVYMNGGTPTACTAYGSATVNKANYAGVTTVGTASLKNIYAGTGSMTASSTSLTTGNIYLQYE